MSLRLPIADCLLLVPPLAHLSWPSLGVHLLQACGRQAGFDVRVVYIGAIFAERIGAAAYGTLCNAPVHWLLGERLFARAAWGAPPLGFETEAFFAELDARPPVPPVTHYVDHLSDSSGEAIRGVEAPYDRAALLGYERVAFDLVDEVAAAVDARVVGATTTFDQTSAAVALLSAVKARRPGTRTVLGGANCEGVMADGVRTLSDRVDVVVSGEAEAAFLDVLGAKDPPRVLRGTPCQELDRIPTPSFADYFDQVRLDAPQWLLYETSRGCWWGAVHHCTFCGLNGEAMPSREKSPDRVVAELRQLVASSPTPRVCLTDNIMPHRYHRTLIPRLPGEVPGLRLFYEQKANVRLHQVEALMEAGCTSIQPGIEALDTGLLQRMRKGVLARQNVALLRYCSAVGMNVKWNLLWGLPGDDVGAYERTLALVPSLVHLPPPQAVAHLHLDRFSPYVERPDDFGITDIEPLPGYRDVFPSTADIPGLAYHFSGRYPSGSRDAPEVIFALIDAVAAWRSRYEADRPVLYVRELPDGFALIDTRGGGGAWFHLSREQAAAVLVGGRLDRVVAGQWAIARGFAVALDGWCVPLATSTVSLMSVFESTSVADPAGSAAPRVIAP